MDGAFKIIIWRQFGAAIDMLENAITMCPPELWDDERMFWHNAYHVLFFLDYDLSEDPLHFAPPVPFTLSELDPAGILPERVYSKEELLVYCRYARVRCHERIAGLTDEGAAELLDNGYRVFPVLEVLIHGMRHVQHHAAQLNLLLRQGMNDAPRWVFRTTKGL